MRITEITGRSRHGRTEPFVCRGADRHLYFVKGQHAGYHSMICEWVTARLAQQLDLPVAPFEIVDLPAALVAGSLVPGALDLGRGEAFGSQEVEFADHFQWSQVEGVDAGLRAQVLVFDWWIANPDRILGELDGNVNLLWTNSPAQLHLIDHNLAFSSGVINESWASFCAHHVFGQCWQGSALNEQHLSGPLGALEIGAAASTHFQRSCENFGLRCQQSCSKIEDFWDELPESWQDNCQTLELKEVKEILERAAGTLW